MAQPSQRYQKDTYSRKALTSNSSGRGHTMLATDMAVASARAVYETNVFSVSHGPDKHLIIQGKR